MDPDIQIRGGGVGTVNNELYLHDHTNTYIIAKAMFRNQNYNTDPEIRLMPGLKKKIYFWPFGPQFGLKIRVGGWRGGGGGAFPRSAKLLFPKTPLLDEVVGKRLNWHPLAIYNPSLLLKETVS